VRFLLEESFPLMGKRGEAVARQHENGDRCVVYSPGKIRGGLLGQLAHANSVDGKTGILSGRAAYWERNSLSQVVFDFQV
jgi:hypothetical protein